MFYDPQFWVGIAFVIFVLAIFNPIRKILGTSLDSKINEIRANIEEAENLKNDTQASLIEIKKRQNEVELEINEIYSNSKDKIKILESQAQIKLSEQNLKKELLSKAKIEQMVRDTNLILQQYITQTAINASIKILEQKLNNEEKQKLINQSVKELGFVLKN